MKEERSLAFRLLVPRLLAWGITCLGGGLGLVTASFVGEDTPIMASWGMASLGLGAVLCTAYLIIRRRAGGR